MNGELPAMEKWQKVGGDIMDRTAKFPKSIRFTFSTRIDGLVLDVIDGLVIARYSTQRERPERLQQVSLHLSRLLALLRMAFDRGHLSAGSYEYLCSGIVEVGSMVGGWRRSVTQARARD